ncbi:Aldo-keto reductase dtxS3 [Colletotrichum fructicola]|uniref:Aldo-keto reductase dtxS3 n=1 Tax=Colletotrichum fructicola (strain Nara gc5) TaxID=1213859 RepID=A0A7J6ITW6_COLFN|nr:Aldo-keto reductase dtxS3 [Colletotrichum fructicola]KAF4480508.1 Aldo-keto reductase dtxS3 [Colletotrichum fructicola Nara gc5]KAE9572110.1 Aldo-keto reductase dtxS3 [Colletotrichum fructicola]KAF4432501.1 Aldo-keto reductase dtxS3 [Colletotrichum fructicola]KAF4895763.1 Aldo-keto reductase dtxS3 [Colletotrichum fructicola]KAF4897165.1 Aldo-keto reductase dtxS3 [Colletotrichum fructicola]
MSAPAFPASLQKSLDATKVEYVNMGTSGLRVSVPILGGMSLGSSEWGSWVLDEEPSLEILKAAYDRGITTWDTANMYSNGFSEQVIGKAIKKFNIPREKIVLMTKCALHVGEEVGMHTPPFTQQLNQSKDYVNQGGLSRIAIFKAVNDALARLDTTYIDLFQIHRVDPATPIEETMKALHDLVQAGKILYIGASSMWATQFARMQFVAEKNNWTKFVSMQNYYNLCYREEEREMNRFCNDTGVGIMPWSPLFGGRLARPLGYDKSIRSQVKGPMSPAFTEADEEIIRRVEEVAGKKGWSMSHVALAWVRSKGAIPVTGFNSVKRIDEACELRGKTLTEDEIKYLEEPYVPRNVMGHF